MDKKRPRILLTGGHGATTGLAVIEEIKKRMPQAEIYWVGSKLAIPGSSVTSLEHKIYPNLGVKYYSISAGKLQTKFTLYTIPLLLMIPVGFIQSLFLLVKIRPNVVLSFGGFASFPVIFWSWLIRIPVILHEQTVVAGRATIMSSFFANTIALSRIESQKYFPKNKSVVTGNPIRSEILSIKPSTLRVRGPKGRRPFAILIMGGSRGSEFINEQIAKIAPELTKKYCLIHIVGERDFPKYQKYQSKMYEIYSFVDPRNMPDIYNRSDMIIERSGANSVSELLIVKKPAILIPLPRTFMNEQVKNAEYARDFGIAKIMLESEVDSSSLLNSIESIYINWSKIVKSVLRKKSLDVNASKQLVDILEKYS